MDYKNSYRRISRSIHLLSHSTVAKFSKMKSCRFYGNFINFDNDKMKTKKVMENASV